MVMQGYLLVLFSGPEMGQPNRQDMVERCCLVGCPIFVLENSTISNRKAQQIIFAGYLLV